MNKRPLSITIISWIFIVTGGIGLVYHLTELNVQHPFENDMVWVCSVRFLAVLGGAFMIYGFNWARWLLVLWMGFHIVLSAMHSLRQLLVHSLLFGAILFFLFRPRASAYFRARSAEPPAGPTDHTSGFHS
jgi:uncharacterized membrane protein